MASSPRAGRWGNTFLRNIALDNGEHDCHDDSAGPDAPSFVANIWEDNRGETENRPGLCVTPQD